MVEGKTMAIITALAVAGGMYITALRAGHKMCANAPAFNTQMSAFESKCSPTTSPSTLDIMKYFVF